MNHNLPGSNEVGMLAALAPVSQAAGTVSTPWIAMKDYATMMAVISVGVLGSSATVDAKIEQAQNSGGTGAKDITGKAITQLTKAGSDDGKQAIINFRQADLDAQNDFTHVRLSLTVATAASLTSAALFGLDQRYGLASDNDASTVDEIV